MKDKKQDDFGFFIYDFTLNVGPYTVEPIDKHDSLVRKLLKRKDPDSGFFYPIGARYKEDSTAKSGFKKIPYTDGPMHLYRMPSTHSIHLKAKQPLPDNFRQKDGALIIHFLAVIYESRAQFSDWYFDTPFPLKQNRIAVFNNKELERAVNTVYTSFSAWNKAAQASYINALYLHARCIAYEWEWERFIMEYIITESLWKLCTDHLKLMPNKGGHGDRIRKMCERFDIQYKQNKIECIVDLRNDLFHEGLWDKTTPGHGTRTNSVFQDMLNLRRINQRLLLAIAGVNCSFVKSDWTCIGKFGLF